MAVNTRRPPHVFLSFSLSLLPFCRRPEPCKHKVERKGKPEVMEARARRRVDISAAVIPKDIADVTGRSSKLGIDGRTLLLELNPQKRTYCQYGGRKVPLKGIDRSRVFSLFPSFQNGEHVSKSNLSANSAGGGTVRRTKSME